MKPTPPPDVSWDDLPGYNDKTLWRALDNLICALSHSWDIGNVRMNAIVKHVFSGDHRPDPKWSPTEQALYDAIVHAIRVRDRSD